MKGVSKNIVLITLLVLINLAIFLFCKLHTDEGNYLWYKTASEKELLVSISCIDLMRIYYFVYANSINVMLLGCYFAYYYKKRLGFILLVIGVLIFYGGIKLFENSIYENYYTIFKNQKVSEDFMLEPIKRGGRGTGSFLMKDITMKGSPYRKYAIIGVGEIQYEPAVEILNTILNDLQEMPQIRGEAYKALVKLDTEQAARYARIFTGSAHPVIDQGVTEYIKGAN